MFKRPGPKYSIANTRVQSAALTHPDGSVFHQPIMAHVLEDTYGLATHYLSTCCSTGEECQLAIVRHPQKAKAVGLPFCARPGLLLPVGSAGSSRRWDMWARHCLLEEMRKLELKSVRFIGMPLIEGLENSMPLAAAYPYARLPLRELVEIQSELHYSLKKALNKAERSGLHVRTAPPTRANTDLFYSFYLGGMKRFGTPPHPRPYFETWFSLDQTHLLLIQVFHKDTVLALLLAGYTANQMELLFTLSKKEGLEYRCNDLAHWQAIELAHQMGLDAVDFGPMKYSGQRRFKEKWGVEESLRWDLGWDLIRDEIRAIPPLSQEHPQLRIGAAFFQNMPRPLLERMGRHIRRTLLR
ncbi:MAG: GNAT family N-acetyltransferase [Candidatus Omnitrophica bacterium]|nr:GNAT family N-acetyltransferase [Candidatus Omnitrophota bacterium]